MNRPATLADVAQRTKRDRDWFQFHLSEFLDEFYMDPGPARRQRRLEKIPKFIGDSEIDAWLCATAEHLAEHWGLRTPEWADDSAGRKLSVPTFSCSQDFPSLRKVLLRVSPPAFRKRNLFVEPDALSRAREATAAGRPG